jgi:peptidoglycan/LPS O-acetylase OafA/YrhL
MEITYLAVFSATIIVASVSYNYFEKYFLVLKNKYAFENSVERTQGPEFESQYSSELVR